MESLGKVDFQNIFQTFYWLIVTPIYPTLQYVKIIVSDLPPLINDDDMDTDVDSEGEKENEVKEDKKLSE